MRVWELAEELRVDATVVLDLIRPHDAYVTSHFAAVPRQALEAIRADPPPPQTGYFGALEERRRKRLPRWRREAEDRAEAERQARRSAKPRRYRQRPGPRPVTFQPLTYAADEDDYIPDPRDRLRDEPIWSTGDIAYYYGVEPSTVRSWVARGHLTPTGQHGPSHIFNSEDVLAAVSAIADRRKHTAQPVRQPADTDDAVTKDELDAVMDIFRADYTRMRTPIETLTRLAASHPNTLVDTDQAARLLNLAPATIRAWVHRGHLKPARTVAGDTSTRYRLDQLHAAATRPSKRRKALR